MPSVLLCRYLALELGCSEGLLARGLDGVELVVPGHLLDEFPAAVVVEDDEVPDQGQEVAPVADSFQYHLELWEVSGARCVVVHGLPGLEPLLPGGQGADAGMESVGDHQELVEGEQSGEFVLVGLELLPSVPDVGVLVGRVLQFDDAQRQPVQEEDDVRSPGGLVLFHGELVDGEPVVIVGVLEVDYGCGFTPLIVPSDGALTGTVTAAGEGVVEGPVPGFQGRPVGVDQASKSGFQRRCRQAGVEVEQGVPEPFFQDDLGEVGRARRLRYLGAISGP